MSACWYKDGAAPPTGPANHASAEALSCSPSDDLASPPFDPNDGARMRGHVTGPLTVDLRRGGRWTWSGGDIPPFVTKEVNTLGLFLLDEADGGYLAFYREPYDLKSCRLGNHVNCAYLALHYDKRGKLVWALELNGLMSRRDHVEIQDIRLAGGVLYFNEACQSYSAEAHGECSSLVAVDPVARKVLWRTEPLVSNSRFLVRGCYLVAGYGFTNEPDQLALISRGTGKVLQTIPVSSAPEQLRLRGRDRLEVRLSAGAAGRFELVNIEASGGALRPLDVDPSFTGYGGAGYGGASYGRPRAPRPHPRPRRP